MESNLKEELTNLFRKLLGIPNPIPTDREMMVTLQHFANG